MDRELVGLLMSPEQVALLDWIAARDKVTRTEVMRAALNIGTRGLTSTGGKRTVQQVMGKYKTGNAGAVPEKVLEAASPSLGTDERPAQDWDPETLAGDPTVSPSAATATA